MDNKKIESDFFIEAIRQEKTFRGELKVEDGKKLEEIFKLVFKKAKKNIDYHGALFPDFWENLKEDTEEAVKRIDRIRFLVDKRLDIERLRGDPKISWLFELAKKYSQKLWIAQAKVKLPHMIFVDDLFFRVEKPHEIGEICNENFIAVNPLVEMPGDLSTWMNYTTSRALYNSQFAIGIPQEVVNNVGMSDGDMAAVQEFIKKQPDIYDYLDEAVGIIKNYFDKERITLEVINDPEDDKETLFLCIKTDRDLDDALKRLKKIDEEWLFDKIEELDDRLVIDIIP